MITNKRSPCKWRSRSCIAVFLLCMLMLVTACGDLPLAPSEDEHSAGASATPSVMPLATTAATPVALAELTWGEAVSPRGSGSGPVATLAAIATTTPPPTLTTIPTLPPLPTTVPTIPPTVPPTTLPTPTTPPAPRDDAALALRPEFADDVAGYAHLPHYRLHLHVDPAAGRLEGHVQIDMPNHTDAPLADVALRLYPNFPPDVFGKGGDTRMDITAAWVDGQMVQVGYAAQDTAVLVPLDPPLLPGERRTVALDFTSTIVPWEDGNWPMPAAYPMLAVRDGAAWRMDVTDFADHVFAESAFYTADITVPAGLEVVASGSTIETETHADGSTTSRVVGGPVREFALTVGRFAVVSAPASEQGDVLVNVYRAQGSELDAAQVARVAAAALTTYEQRFGAYPYRELDIHLLPGAFDGGWEFPGLILLASDAQVDAGTRYVTAHEVAHQWWYGVVGNDIYREPWLDEAFAQYSAIIYAEEVEGAAVAEADWEREVLQRYRGAVADGDLPVGWAIDAYPNFNVYYRTVYGKGAVFLRTLRDHLGDEVFFAGLQRCYWQHRYGIATTQSVQQAFEEVSGQRLDGLFDAWVE